MVGTHQVRAEVAGGGVVDAGRKVSEHHNGAEKSWGERRGEREGGECEMSSEQAWKQGNESGRTKGSIFRIRLARRDSACRIHRTVHRRQLSHRWRAAATGTAQASRRGCQSQDSPTRRDLHAGLLMPPPTSHRVQCCNEHHQSQFGSIDQRQRIRVQFMHTAR
ncbi:hypothetical protein K491DRAFT_399104 [Lophiostoma macrostomum CBS 122681]|uniref:Uncharacterized protein n=1 Tax=Lophiostoma macrostomum CBS 122681 TaxID=1314788 RepID=A0A6A6TAA0_9PLEO|nr:hypothetical protein K491DRAFT_399104 [Lophiostoma macrostomum CBS 122681]